MVATSFRITLTAAVAAILVADAQAQNLRQQLTAPAGIQQAAGVQAVAIALHSKGYGPVFKHSSPPWEFCASQTELFVLGVATTTFGNGNPRH